MTLDEEEPAFDIERGGDGQCGFDYRAQVSALDLATGAERWAVEVPYPEEGELHPAGDQVIARSSNYPSDPASVFAVDASDGTPRWQREVADSSYVQGQPQVSADLVVTLDGSSVVALYADDGTEGWRAEAGEDPNLVVDGPDVALGRNDTGELLLLDVETGRERWAVDLGGEDGPVPVALRPTRVIALDGNRSLVGIDRQTGQVVWTSPRPAGDARRVLDGPAAGPVIEAVIGVPDARLEATDPETGVLLWQLPTGGAASERAVILGDLVIAPDNTTVQGIEVATGTPVWTVTLADVVQMSRPTPDLLVFGASDFDSASSTLVAVDAASGEQRWSIPLSVSSTGPVTAVGDQLLVGGGVGQDSALVDADDDGRVFAVGVRDGDMTWEARRRDAAMASILVRGDDAIVLTADQPIFCD